MRCAGGEMRISHVLLKMEEGMRRMARAAEVVRLVVMSVVSRLAAGGNGDKARGLRWEMATEVVVAARWRMGLLLES